MGGCDHFTTLKSLKRVGFKCRYMYRNYLNVKANIRFSATQKQARKRKYNILR